MSMTPMSIVLRQLDVAIAKTDKLSVAINGLTYCRVTASLTPSSVTPSSETPSSEYRIMPVIFFNGRRWVPVYGHRCLGLPHSSR